MRAVPIAVTILLLCRSVAAQAPAATPGDEPSPFASSLKFFSDRPVQLDDRWKIGTEGGSVWKPYTDPGTLPTWKLGYTAHLQGPKGVQFSAGASARRGDPFPAHVSDAIPNALAFSSMLPALGPGAYRTQLDLRFGVDAPVWTSSAVNLRVRAELFAPVAATRLVGPDKPGSLSLAARAFRVSAVLGF